jgi:hypothetical protein
MAILTECDICGHQHRVKDALAGQTIRCRDCGVSLKVSREMYLSDELASINGRLQQRELVPRDNIWTWVAAIGATSFVLVALAVVGWMFNRLILNRSVFF